MSSWLHLEPLVSPSSWDREGENSATSQQVDGLSGW
uniref:Uncharacterized protein n=1 Tax=Anguilla anguilla TaxID=7936 RepID=A0A0E9WCV5_ANGAN